MFFFRAARSSETVFFFQAEDGIRAPLVTGVQTCALPISRRAGHPGAPPPAPTAVAGRAGADVDLVLAAGPAAVAVPHPLPPGAGRPAVPPAAPDAVVSPPSPRGAGNVDRAVHKLGRVAWGCRSLPAAGRQRPGTWAPALEERPGQAAAVQPQAAVGLRWLHRRDLPGLRDPDPAAARRAATRRQGSPGAGDLHWPVLAGPAGAGRNLLQPRGLAARRGVRRRPRAAGLAVRRAHRDLPRAGRLASVAALTCVRGDLPITTAGC